MGRVPRDHITDWDPRQIDTWSHLAHKAQFDGKTDLPWRQSEEIPPTVRRRFAAYSILSSYMVNNARQVLVDVGPDRILQQREYGDAALIVDRIVAGILGDDLSIDVADIAEALTDPPSLDDRPDGDIDAEGIDGEFAKAILAVWEEEKTAELEAWVKRRTRLPALRKSKEWLDQWAIDEQVLAKITENETSNIVPLGDGVYEFAWSSRKVRPRLMVHAPDAYYPDLDDDEAGADYPRTVHLAWQVDLEDYAGKVAPEEMVWRRITYRIVPIDDLELEPGDRPNYLEDGQPLDEMCVMSDVTFHKTDHSEGEWADYGAYVTDWPSDAGRPALNEDGEPLLDYPLGIDFIPVIHVPNTLSTLSHFGTSSLARVIRLLDDISDLDTELMLAVALAGNPMIGVENVNVNKDQPLEVMPGMLVPGKLTHVDMSPSVKILIESLDTLLERLSVNVQIPESMLGRLDETGEFPSGVALRLSFLAFINLVNKLRLARRAKYALLFKMAQRFHKNFDDPDHLIVDANLSFGEFIPPDVASIGEVVTNLLNSHGISRTTAAQMLQEAGFPIEDIGIEVDEIEREDSAGRKELAEAALAAATAVGSEEPAYLILGMEPPEEPEPLPDAQTGGLGDQGGDTGDGSDTAGAVSDPLAGLPFAQPGAAGQPPTQ